MSKLKALTHRKLFLPIVSMILVMLINVIYDTATGSAPFSFFYITVKNGVLYGRLIDVLNRGSEIAILAIGMTIVVSAYQSCCLHQSRKLLSCFDAQA